MTLAQFRSSLQKDVPPDGLSPALLGLWWDAKGHWGRAHESAQVDEGPDGAWVHAYLHRKEEDEANARYWYRRAGRTAGAGPFDQEWLEIARTLLEVKG